MSPIAALFALALIAVAFLEPKRRRRGNARFGLVALRLPLAVAAGTLTAMAQAGVSP